MDKPRRVELVYKGGHWAERRSPLHRLPGRPFRERMTRGFHVVDPKTRRDGEEFRGAAPKGRPITALGNAQGAGYGSVGRKP
jgi:hypothetical protein